MGDSVNSRVPEATVEGIAAGIVVTGGAGTSVQQLGRHLYHE